MNRDDMIGVANGNERSSQVAPSQGTLMDGPFTNTTMQCVPKSQEHAHALTFNK